MVDRLVAVNDSDYRLPEPVIQALGTDMSDSGTTIGAILADAYVPSSEVTITQVGSGWNFKAGHPDNVIAPDVLGSIIGGDGTPGRENVIGKGVIANVNTGLSNVPANPADLLEADVNKRANHSFCVGYDNVIAGLKGVILADHSYIAFNATHNAILGGAVHKIVVGDFSVIGGGYTNSILDGDYCVIVGGYLNTINVPGGGNCTVGGSNTTVTGSAGTAFGNFNTVTGIGGLAIGVEASAADGAAIGNKVTASGVKSLATGNLMTASGNYSRASGNNGTATADGAVSEGVLSHATAAYATARGLQAIARIAGQQAVANGAFAVAGDAQISDIVQRATTTSATVGSMPGYLLNPAQTVQYRVMVTARDTATGNSATWELKGAAKRIASAAAVAVGSSFPAATLIAADAGASGWACSASASTNSVVLLLTGAAATTIRWVARFEVVELGG